ncbi:MAG: AAA family ATPase [Lachnospiraceae bacterium]|nr:AAA family ATPase [Lachnospiraceae bacterium]
MFVGRKKELKFLEDNFAREEDRLLVVYGHKGVGKSSLMFRFAQGKKLSYYAARPCSGKEQLFLWGQELGMEGADSFDAVFSRIAQERGEEKLLLVIDEFQYLIKYADDFMQALARFRSSLAGACMIVLLSSSTSFVETDFVPRIGQLALSIGSFYKLQELGFMDCVNYFRNYSTRQCMEVFSILGGIPAYWKAFDPSRSPKENIIAGILEKDAPLREEGERIVSAELRELNVYCTLLGGLASGRNKLNDLHLQTGYSRAKISVYLRNLMERELVEKVFSFDNASGINAKKGVYRVGLRYLEFYFRFLYGKQSALQSLPAGEFYERYVEPELPDFHQKHFYKVCAEYLEILNQNRMLPIRADKSGEWVGKNGSIDIVLQNEEGESILAFCEWGKEEIGMEELRHYLQTAREARLTPDHLYLFATGAFSEELKAYTEEHKNLRLIDIDTL